MIAIQQEQSSATLCELQREGSKKSCEAFPEEKKEPFKWTRLPGQVKCFLFKEKQFKDLLRFYNFIFMI